MNKYFLIGIKGSGMASLASILKMQGHYVVGSDVDEHIFTQDKLDNLGIDYYLFDKYDFSDDYIVIAGNSFKTNFSEVEKAKSQNNKFYYYYEFLGLMSKSEYSLAVTGTHGKTTTTTMLKDIFMIDNEVSYLVGDGNGGSSNNAKYFVFEACEYQNHFHYYYPDYAIITNVGLDHQDFFTSQEIYDSAYLTFSENVQKKIVACGDDANTYQLFKDNPKVLFYGTSDKCDFKIENVELLKTGCTFELVIEGARYQFSAKVYGMHNVLNLTAAIAVAYLNGIDLHDLNQKYDGVVSAKRRFEEYIYENQIIIDDYAHHPDEVKVFLDAVFQKYPNEEIIAVFEPHTISRLKAHYLEFAKELNRCKEQIILKVEVPLRDLELYGEDHLESDIMIKHLNNGFFNPENLNDYLMKKENCVIVFIGATISKYCEHYIDTILEFRQENKKINKKHH